TDDHLAELGEHHVAGVSELVQQVGNPIAGARHAGLRLRGWAAASGQRHSSTATLAAPENRDGTAETAAESTPGPAVGGTCDYCSARRAGDSSVAEASCGSPTTIPTAPRRWA